MELIGKIWKESKYWLAEVPVLDIATQGRTRKEVMIMIEDAIRELLNSYFQQTALKGFNLTISDHEKNVFSISASDSNILSSFLLIRQREISQSTIREVAERLGSKSPNSYAQYERGKMRITLNQYERLLQAVNPDSPLSLRVS